jgi:hypothetical protein
MGVVPTGESRAQFEAHLQRAHHAVYLAQARALLCGYEGAADDLAGMGDHLSVLLHDSASETPAGRRKLRQARAA